MWAIAEILWDDPVGISCRAPATMEDTSLSGACVRVKQPFSVGSRITIKWCREQFNAVAKNCRKDGKDFLLGVKRDPAQKRQNPSLPARTVAQTKPADAKALEPPKEKATAALHPRSEKPDRPAIRSGQTTELPSPSQPQSAPASSSRPPDQSKDNSASVQKKDVELEARPKSPEAVPPVEPSHAPARGRPLDSERKVMVSNNFFSKLWRRPPNEPGVPGNKTSPEVPVNKSNGNVAEGLTGPHSDLLSYDDIYHAAGVMSPASGYSIDKVVDMLNNDRIRDLSKEAKRASVLMALDAGGASIDDVLHDALRRQQALNSYEAGQRKQFDEFEARKARENSQIEAEMERLRAHYAERIQRNRDLVMKEKETLHNWQMAMQHESQRISEVIELCGGQPTPALAPAAGNAAGSKPAEKTPLANAHSAS